MSAASELARIRRDVASLEEEIATTLGPRAKVQLSTAERRSVRSELQALIQRLDELSGKLAG